MATTTERIIQLTHGGYNLFDIAATLGISPEDVEAVWQDQSHQVTAPGGLSLDARGYPVLPTVQASVLIPLSGGGIVAQMPLLGTGSLGPRSAEAIGWASGLAIAVGAGQPVCRAPHLNGPASAQPLSLVEVEVINLDGSASHKTYAEAVQLLGDAGPLVLDHATLESRGEGADLSMGVAPGPDDGAIISAAGGSFFVRLEIVADPE